MQHFEFKPIGVCSVLISFDLDEEKRIHNLIFTGGCNGNLKAIGILCENKKAEEISELLKGNTCRTLETSCADQLAIALQEALN